MYFAMLMSLALIVPFGLIVFNLIATMIGGTLRMRAPLLFAIGAISAISIGLAAEIEQSMVAAAWQLKNTTDATAATHFALIGGAVFGGFAALHYWFPKMTGRTMGENLARISFWTMAVGILVAFVPLFLAGGEQGEVIDAYKFFDQHRRQRLQPDRLDRRPRPRRRDRHDAGQRDPQPRERRRGRPRPLGRRLRSSGSRSRRRTRTTSTSCPDVRSARPMRDIREAIAHRTSRASAPARESQPVA